MSDKDVPEPTLEDWHKLQKPLTEAEKLANRIELATQVIFCVYPYHKALRLTLKERKVQLAYHLIGFAPGYYFWDESALQHGPFSSRKLAEQALNQYCEELN